MDLLKQCQQWFEQDEAQKVIDTLEAIPAEERTPELDSELAKAYGIQGSCKKISPGLKSGTGRSNARENERSE